MNHKAVIIQKYSCNCNVTHWKEATKQPFYNKSHRIES